MCMHSYVAIAAYAYVYIYHLHYSVLCIYVCICAHVLYFIDLMSFLFVHCSQLPLVSPWSSKDTVQTSSPSSVDTVRLQEIHNDTTVEGGDVLDTAFPGAVYTVQALTEHTATITGVDNVRALDGYLFQCVYDVLGNLIKSNEVQFSFIPPGQS